MAHPVDYNCYCKYYLSMAAQRRRRPLARTSIHEVDSVMPAGDSPLLEVNHCELSLLCRDAESVLCWVAQHGLIHNELRCGNCDIPMSLHSRRGETFEDGFSWACRICKRQRRVTVDSFFEGSHLTLVQLIDCLYILVVT